MVSKTAKILLAASVFSGLAVPAKSGIYMPPKPAIVKAENLEMSKNMLLAMPITMGMLPSKSEAPNISYVSRNSADLGASTAASRTFTAQSIGAADANRIVIVGASAVWATTWQTVTGVTLGGTAMTQIEGGATGAAWCRLYALAVSAGTTANIVVSTTANANSFAIAVWRLVRTSTDFTTGRVTANAYNASTSPITVSFTSPANAAVVCYYQSTNSGIPSASGLTGATTNFTTDVRSTDYHSALTATGVASGSTSISWSATTTASYRAAAVLAAWPLG